MHYKMIAEIRPRRAGQQWVCAVRGARWARVPEIVPGDYTPEQAAAALQAFLTRLFLGHTFSVEIGPCATSL